MASRVALAGAFLLAALTAPRATGREDAHDRPPVALDNSSSVEDGTEWVRRAFERADAAAQGEAEWPEVVRGLQRVVEARESREEPGKAASYVVAVRGSEGYEGAARAAHHRILGAPPEGRAAYEREFGEAAAALLTRALASRDESLLAEVVDRFLPLEPGRRAALALTDLAIERGDRDGAAGWLDRLEDAEETTAGPDPSLPPIRRARLARLAHILVADRARLPAVRAALEEAAAAGAAHAARGAAVRPTDRRVEPAPADWRAPGGRPDRNALPPGGDRAARLAWAASPHAAGEFRERPDPGRASPWFPTRGAVVGDRLFVSDGSAVTVHDLSGDPAAEPVRFAFREEPVLEDWNEDPRARWGLLEGHSLTVYPAAGGGVVVVAAIPHVWTWYEGGGSASEAAAGRDDHLLALHFDGERFVTLWRAGGTAEERPASGIRLYGAPLLYRGRLWTAGVRSTESKDRFEAWVLGLDPLTGRVEVETLLGTGNPVRNDRPDEAIPSSPAGAKGRVVVTTGLGIAGAVDARDGRVVWLFKYDRDVVDPSRAGRLKDARDEEERESVATNDPPLLALDRCFVAPTDSSKVLCLFDRPRGAAREIVSWRRWRLGTQFAGMAAEQLVAVVPDPRAGAVLVVVGKGAAGEADPPGPVVVGLDALEQGVLLWRAAAPGGGGSIPCGRAMATTTEVLVPTWDGIAVYETRANGRLLAFLDLTTRDPAIEGRLPADAFPYGNLLPVPGRGFVALGPDGPAYWRRP